VRSRVPAKIDIGPLYNYDPSKNKAYKGAAGRGLEGAGFERVGRRVWRRVWRRGWRGWRRGGGVGAA